MSMDSKRFKAISMLDSIEFDSLQECIKHAVNVCREVQDKGIKVSSCHVSIFDNTSESLVGFVFVRRANWIRVDINSNYLEL